MLQNEPVILIDDDPEDQEIFKSALLSLYPDAQFKGFTRCSDAKDYLLTTGERPFIIFCDINMPLMNGIEFKKQVDADPYLRKKSIPFVFYSTGAEEIVVEKAYTELNIQGFFKKPDTYEAIKKKIETIIAYWDCCIHPNNFQKHK